MAGYAIRVLKWHMVKTLLVFVTSISCFGVIIHESYIRANRALTDEFRSRAKAIASTGALLLAADDLDALTRSDQAGSFEHRRVLSILHRIRDTNPEIRRIVTIRKSPQASTAVYIVDDFEIPPGTGRRPEPAKIGQEFSIATHPRLLASFEHPTGDDDISEMPGGEPVFTGFAPIFYAKGDAAAVLGVSIEATSLQKKRLRFLASASISFGIMMVLAATSGVLYLRKERVYHTNLDLLRESRQDLTRMIQAEKELTRKNRELQVLNAVSEHLSQSFELSRNLYLSLDRLLEVAGIDAAIVRLTDLETQELFLAAHRGLSPLLFEGYQRIAIGQSFSGSVAASGEALFVENIPAAFGTGAASPFDRRIRSYAIVPLRVKDRILGTLTLFSLSDPRFPSPYKSLIFSFCQQIAVAIENSNLFEKERNRSAQLSLVAEISKQSVVTMNIDQLLQMAIERIQREFHFFFIAYYEIDRQREICVRKAECGGFFEMGYGNLNYQLPLSEGMIAIAYQAKHTIYVPDTSAEEHFSGSPGNLAKSNLVVPVLIKGEVIGLFELQSTMIKGFSGEDILMVETLADQIASAIKNMSLYKSLQLSQERLEELSVQPSSAPATKEPESKISQAPKHMRPKILVIDDEDYILDLIVEILSAHDSIVTPAKDGEEGVSAFEKDSFDLVLTDLTLPKMDGWEVARSVKRMKPHVPVVLLTGWEMTLQESKIREYGVDRVISKPFRIEDILSCLTDFSPRIADS